MIAKTSKWMMATDSMQHTWTKDKDYDIRKVGEYLVITSDTGTEKIHKDNCDPELFRTVFGFDLTAGKGAQHQRRYFKDWRNRT